MYYQINSEEYGKKHDDKSKDLYIQYVDANKIIKNYKITAKKESRNYIYELPIKDKNREQEQILVEGKDIANMHAIVRRKVLGLNASHGNSILFAQSEGKVHKKYDARSMVRSGDNVQVAQRNPWYKRDAIKVVKTEEFNRTYSESEKMGLEGLLSENQVLINMAANKGYDEDDKIITVQAEVNDFEELLWVEALQMRDLLSKAISDPGDTGKQLKLCIGKIDLSARVIDKVLQYKAAEAEVNGDLPENKGEVSSLVKQLSQRLGIDDVIADYGLEKEETTYVEPRVALIRFNENGGDGLRTFKSMVQTALKVVQISAKEEDGVIEVSSYCNDKSEVTSVNEVSVEGEQGYRVSKNKEGGEGGELVSIHAGSDKLSSLSDVVREDQLIDLNILTRDASFVDREEIKGGPYDSVSAEKSRVDDGQKKSGVGQEAPMDFLAYQYNKQVFNSRVEDFQRP